MPILFLGIDCSVSMLSITSSKYFKHIIFLGSFAIKLPSQYHLLTTKKLCSNHVITKNEWENLLLYYQKAWCFATWFCLRKFTCCHQICNEIVRLSFHINYYTEKSYKVYSHLVISGWFFGEIRFSILEKDYKT